MKQIYASIITIGDELLIGQVVDTNSSWIAQQLISIGITVLRRVAIGDDRQAIINALDEEGQKSQLVLITGGLGPTSDDITKDVLCDYFGGKMVMNEGALQNVIHLFEKIYQRPTSAVNRAQAMVPDVCEVIQNKRGSAPGMLFRKNEVIYISMPGVPYEMQGIVQELLPLLKQQWNLPFIYYKTLLTSGIGESALAEKISDIENNLPEKIKLAYLPNYGMVRLRLTSTDEDGAKMRQQIEEEFAKLKVRVAEYLVTDEDEKLSMVVGKLLLKNNQTMATAESCTGGAIASLITAISGSSQYYKGSIISYANEVKQNLLHVPQSILNTDGAVSESTVKAMLSGLLTQINADYGVAVSGIMGPNGGSEEKPVGTVWIAVGNKERCHTKKISLRFEREKNIERTSMLALDLLRQFILNKI